MHWLSNWDVASMQGGQHSGGAADQGPMAPVISWLTFWLRWQPSTSTPRTKVETGEQGESRVTERVKLNTIEVFRPVCAVGNKTL